MKRCPVCRQTRHTPSCRRRTEPVEQIGVEFGTDGVDAQIPIGGGMTYGTDGEIGYNVGGGVTIEADGDIRIGGFNLTGD